MSKATPRPVFGFCDKTSLHRITVNVPKLLREFGTGEDVEVVISRLPEVGTRAFQELRGLSLKNSERIVEALKPRLGQEHVYMLGHQNVAKEEELMPVTHSFESVQKYDAGVIVIEIW